MLYTVNLDDNGYILSVAHTSHDNVELDLKEIHLEYLNAYQLKDGKPVLDEKRKEELIADQGELSRNEQIQKLILQLESSNDEMLEFV